MPWGCSSCRTSRTKSTVGSRVGEVSLGSAARLAENKLPSGEAVLLYGKPGTGKTETALQLARSTHRAIMHVDISATKTCWFGEGDAQQLAATYDFSGGQIDNIVRKSLMEEVVKGTKPTLSSLMVMCSQEKISGAGNSKIGF